MPNPEQQILRGIKDPTRLTGVSPMGDLYSFFNLGQPYQQSVNRLQQQQPLLSMLNGKQADPLKTDINPLQTSLSVIQSFLDNEDGIDKYGYSDFLNQGDNEDRYAQNFKKDNPNLFGSFWRKPFTKIAYWGGGFIEKTIESAIIKTGQGLSNLISMVATGIYDLTINQTQDLLSGKNEHTFSDWLSKATDNGFANMFDGWEENLKSRYDYFQEASDRGKKGFIESLGDGDFWMNDISDGLSFLLSAAIEVDLISKLGAGAKLASRIGPKAAGTSSLAIGGTEAVTLGGRVLKTLGGAKNFSAGVDMTTQILATTAIEAGVEANEVKDKIYNSLSYKINPDTNMPYTEEEKLRLSADGAAQVFRQNMAILIGPKFLEVMAFKKIGGALKSKLFKNSKNNISGTASSKLTNTGVFSDASISKLTTLQKYLQFGKIGGLAGLGFISEALWEENVQLAISREADEQFGAGEYSRPSADQESIDERTSGTFSPFYGDVGERYLKQLNTFFEGKADRRDIDDELSKSIGIGGLFGVGGGGIAGYSDIRQKAKIDTYWKNRINNSKNNFLASGHFYKTVKVDKPDPNDPSKTIPTDEVVIDQVTKKPMIDTEKFKAFIDKQTRVQDVIELINATQEDSTDPEIINKNNEKLNEIARLNLFADLASQYVQAGKANLLKDNLLSLQNLSEKDLEALGYSTANSKNSTENQEDFIGRLSNMVDDLVKSNDWIDKNIIDNVSERREGKFGVFYTKAQKEKRAALLAAKKEYLRDLAIKRAINRSYRDDIDRTEANLSVVPQYINDNIPLEEYMTNASRELNSRLPAVNNTIKALEAELAHYWENIRRESNSPKRKAFSVFSKSANNSSIIQNQIRFEETLEKINKLQSEAEELTGRRTKFLEEQEENFELVEDQDGDFYISPKQKRIDQTKLTLDELNNQRTRRINDIRREELNIQDNWIDEEWRKVAALKEEKTKQERDDTYFSRRMSLSKNAYNQYFQREVYNKNATLGQRKMKLWDNDESKRVTTKQYIANEEKLMKATRIEGKIRNILADINGKKLLAEIEALLEKNLPSEQFAPELQAIIDSYKGKAITLSEVVEDIDSKKADIERRRQERLDSIDFDKGVTILGKIVTEDSWGYEEEGTLKFKAGFKTEQDVINEINAKYDAELSALETTTSAVKTENDKSFIDDLIEQTNDEWMFVNEIFENMPEDERFNDTYYDIDENGQYVVKQQYDSIPALAQVSNDLKNRLDDYKKIKNFLNSVPKSLPGDWSNPNLVRKRIADVYTESADNIIDSYNKVSNGGQSEVAGDSFSTKQDLDKANEEINELTQLKVIFQGRPDILATPEFEGYIESLDARIEKLKDIAKIIKERLSSRLKENKNFLIDQVNDLVESLGLTFEGQVLDQGLHDVIEKVATPEVFSKLKVTLQDLSKLITKEDKTAEDNKAIEDAYWTINGQIAAIHQVLKSNPGEINSKVSELVTELVTKLEATDVLKKSPVLIQKEVVANMKDSVLGTLRFLFFSNGLFTEIGSPMPVENFYDDNPVSPVYKFREDMNLRKLARNLETDTLRNADNSPFTNEQILELVRIAQKIQGLQDLQNSVNSTHNLLEQIEKEKEVVQAKMKEAEEKKENKYENLIVPSIQQLNFIRAIGNFMRRNITLQKSNNIEAKKDDIERRRQEELNKSDLFHTGDDLTIDNVSVEPRVSRQGRKGKYGGLYTYSNLSDIENFQRGNNTKEIFGIKLKDGVKIIDYDGGIERLSKDRLDDLRNSGVKVIRGKSLLGVEEIVIIDKDAIESISESHSKINAKYDAELAELEKSKPLGTISQSESFGFRNWIFIQAPGGAGKSQTLGTWFNTISGIPRDRVLATAFTEEAAKGIKRALLVGEEGPKDANEMAEYINQLIKDKNYDQEVLIIDEFPAIDIDTQRALFQAVQEYSKAKHEAGKGTFKVVTLGDVNQLTFSKDGVVSPISSMNNAPYGFRNWGTDTANKYPNEHIAKLNVVPSLTINFRSNLFPITSFIENFKGSNQDNLNTEIKVSSTDPLLERPDTKGVVAVSKAEFPSKLVSYLKVSLGTNKTRALIVNESKIAQYKKTLTDAGITIITDPNDEVTKGIYVGTVRSVQGFSFDEVFIDVEPNDKTLFGGSSVPNFEYNKAMYVAASRARNLIVVTNFSKIENVEDEGIADLEAKAIEELQTKDGEFIANRDLEINGAKSILGDRYATNVKTAAPVKAETKNTSALDDEEEEEEDEDEETSDEDVEETKKETEAEEDPTIEEDELEDDEEGQDDPGAAPVLQTDGLEDNISDDITSDKTLESEKKTIMGQIKDKAVQVYDKVRDSVVKLLFPTSQTLKFKISDGSFAVKPTKEYEFSNTVAGDKVMIVPFRQDKKSKSNRNFGYAVITPAKDVDGAEVPNTYRTLAVLSDKEIDALKDNPKTKQIYNDIEQNELRDKGFVSLLYGDISSEDGFKATGGKDIGEPIAMGTVAAANTVKYFFGKDFKKFDHGQMNDIISKFVDSFYANQIEKDPSFRQKAREFYADPKNAQVIIPIRKDVVEGKNTKARLDIPEEMKGFVQPGKPYLVFRPFGQKSGMQFVSLSRRYLNSSEHSETTLPIQEFISLAKVVRQILNQKGLGDEKLGYSKGLSNMLSKLANEFLKDSEKDSYTVKATFKKGDKSEAKEVTFTNVEAQKIVDMYVDYLVPDLNTVVANTEKEIIALSKVKKARNLTFEDGTTIYGTVVSYDPATKTSVIKDVKNKEEVTKAGAISHTAKSYTGKVQKILNDIINSNGHIADKLKAVKGRTSFITDRDRQAGEKKEFTGYKFMNLLGSKTSPVAKTYNSKGEPETYFEDVIDILETLFNFAKKGELPGANIQTIDNEGNRENIEVKFRVPVPLNARDENGKLTHDYQNANTNTSRDTGNVSNSKFFETNFEGILPVHVYVEFGEERQEHGQSVQVDNTDDEYSLNQLEKALADKMAALMDNGADIVTAREIAEKELSDEDRKALNILRSRVKKLPELTEDDIQELSFKEIRERLTQEQVKKVDKWAEANGFESIDNFFASAESNHPDEQVYFKDYLIQCLL